MKRRVREILLVSTFYDAFIFEQDGRLSEQIHGEYRQLNLSTSPRITNVPTGEQALKLLETSKFDLVITMMRIGEIGPFRLSEIIKENHPKLSILLLINVSNDMALIDKDSPKMQYIDNVFIWSGDSKIFLTMIKYVEDRWNVANDTKEGLVRVILLVEDSVHYYSMFHPLLYAEIMKQTEKLIGEELDDINKRRRMRGRPKVLLCHTYEEAVEIYDKYKDYLVAVISDIRYKRNNKVEPEAGIYFIKYLLDQKAECPILLQSSEKQNQEKANELGVQFLHKKSNTLLNDLRNFIIENLGFGDFIFRDPSGIEINRVSNLNRFIETLYTIPGNSIAYHLNRNHFSTWLTAHGEFLYAREIKILKEQTDLTIEDLRSRLIKISFQVNQNKNRGKIIAFDPDSIKIEDRILQLSGGSLGGKGRGIAFLNSLLTAMNWKNRYKNWEIKIPKTYIIGTDEFDIFLKQNPVEENLSDKTDEEIESKFIKGHLSQLLTDKLRCLIENVDFPLAVRSSSLLEDSQFQSFAGIYQTYLLSNNQKNPEKRLKILGKAIKLVFASVFLRNARNYIESISYKLEEEKMAVLIQEVIGLNHSGYFYPLISGVAQSGLYGSSSEQGIEPGSTSFVLGLGKAINNNEPVVKIDFKKISRYFSQTNTELDGDQSGLYALNMGLKEDLPEKLELWVEKIGISDGVIRELSEVFLKTVNDKSQQNDFYSQNKGKINLKQLIARFKDSLIMIITELLDIGEKTFSAPVEIEFSINMLREKEILKSSFNILQIRPLIVNTEAIVIDEDELEKEDLFLISHRSLGNGETTGILDVVFLDFAEFNLNETLKMKTELAQINEEMKISSRNYILIGPGNWGTLDRYQGIPVKWSDIDQAKILIQLNSEELNFSNQNCTHFFSNLTTMNIGYCTVYSESDIDFIDLTWLKQQSLVRKTGFFTHFQLSDPVKVKIDGRNCLMVINKKG